MSKTCNLNQKLLNQTISSPTYLSLSLYFTYTYTHTHTHTHTHIYIHIHTHIHTYRGIAMANYRQELAQDAVCHSHTGHMTGLWFLPARPLGLNTNEWMNMYIHTHTRAHMCVRLCYVHVYTSIWLFLNGYPPSGCQLYSLNNCFCRHVRG